MEKLLKKIAEIQELYPDDRLTSLINRYSDEELDEEMLDMVSAAGKDDYAVFMKKFGNHR